MVLNVICTVFELTVPFGHIGDKEMLHQTLRALVKVTWESDFALQNFLIDSHRVFIVEGVNSGDHLVSKDTKSPPIYRFSMALIEKYLRR